MAELVHSQATGESIRYSVSPLVVDSTTDNNNVSETSLLLKKPKTKKGHRSLKLRQFIVMASCFITHTLILGVNSCLGVVYVELIREFNALRAEAALVQSIYLGTLFLGGVLFTKVIPKFGPGVCGATGLMIMSISFLITIFSTHIYMVIIFGGFIAGLGASVTFLSDFAAVDLAFKTNKRTALAVLTISTTFGQFAFPYIAEILLEYYYWDGTFLIMSGIILQGVPSGVLIYFSEHVLHKLEPNSSRKNVTFKEAFRNPSFILFSIIMIAPDVGLFTQLFFIVDLSELRGFERITGALFSSVLGISSFFGRVLGLILLCVFVNTGASVHFTYGLVFYGIAHTVVGYFKDYWTMFVGVVLEGFSSGLLVATFSGVIIEQCGADIFLFFLAVSNVLTGIVDMVGGFVGGNIADKTGDYSLMYYIAAGCAAGGVVLMLARLFMKQTIGGQKHGNYKAVDMD